MMKSQNRAVLILISAATLCFAGCTVGPKYVRPRSQAPRHSLSRARRVGIWTKRGSHNGGPAFMIPSSTL